MVVLLRLLAAMALIGPGGFLLAWLFTKNRLYLDRAFLAFKIMVGLAILVLGFMLLERLLMTL